jgi:hypothetical protein
MTIPVASLTDEELVEQLAELVKEYVARVQAEPVGPVPAARWATRLNATECALISVDLLRAAEITSFELAAMFNI